ncbi:HD domain-containing protein [Actinokineospora iranica]|uniref:Predicted metal-dependent phosphohydrolase, HD superfamily n=1 Tax=Actinokineospora iranica TaxID=1271860 RepID=A0A1G6RG50_9PSEU|nr:metal-dependent phosphohydrolase [Actinokineospora iranica]SDD03421.1 Predicted metal-dependent phosphohydrolase, HD superfamily [Actinokineospora iranica]
MSVERWSALTGSLGLPDTGGAALVARWEEPHRRYHDLAHLHAVLDGVDLLADHAADPDLARLAAWYHDAIYQGRGDDEEQSARLAETELTALGLPAPAVAEVARLVRLTNGHKTTPGDTNGEVLCDADLAILASPAYWDYTEAIRAEYAFLPDAVFRAGRAAVLQGLLTLPTLYRTPLGQELWEAPARANLHAELTRLTPA